MDRAKIPLAVVAGVLGYIWWTRKKKETSQRKREKIGVRVVCISDTHGKHRDMSVPEGDILIHAGDYTHFGKHNNARDFNSWLGELPHKCKIVVEGNHEANAGWNQEKTLTNCTFLKGSCMQYNLLQDGTYKVVKIYGSPFFWPLSEESPVNPYIVPPDADIIVTHGPPKGMNDEGTGCPLSLAACQATCPRLVVSGHIHSAAGVVDAPDTTYVNAAMCQDGYAIKRKPFVVDI